MNRDVIKLHSSIFLHMFVISARPLTSSWVVGDLSDCLPRLPAVTSQIS